MRDRAIFLNGVYDRILDEITEIHCKGPTQGLFIQPTGDGVIRYLQTSLPSRDDPVTLYCSTTEDLQNVHYTAQIVDWDNKYELEGKKRERAKRLIKQFQKKEGAGLFEALNLIEVQHMRRFAEPFPVDKLIKINNGEPLSDSRTRSGGFAYVYPLEDTPSLAEC